MPMVYPLVKNFFIDSMTTLSGGNGATSGSSTMGNTRPGYKLGSRTQHSKRSGPFSIPNDTCWGSEENIVADGIQLQPVREEMDQKTTSASSTDGEQASPVFPIQAPPPPLTRKSTGDDDDRMGRMSQQCGSSGVKRNNSKSRMDNVGGENKRGTGIVVTHEYTVTEATDEGAAGPVISKRVEIRGGVHANDTRC